MKRVVRRANCREAARLGGGQWRGKKADVHGVLRRVHVGGLKRLQFRQRDDRGARAHEGVHLIAEPRPEVRGDPGGDRLWVACAVGEDHITAGDEGLDFREIQLLEQFAEPRHFDPTLAEVDAAEKGEVAGHPPPLRRRVRGVNPARFPHPARLHHGRGRADGLIYSVMLKLRLLSALLGPLVCVSLGSDHAAPAKPKVAAEIALEILLAGNKRFVAGRPMFPDQSPARRRELAGGQKPFAIVLTCADSRVAPELYFDQGLGNLFVLRNAGNILDDHTIGSIEYAVDHLKAGLVIVVGHEKCGAVAAAVAGGHAPGHVHSIVEAIQPAVQASAEQTGDKVDNAVRANARLVAAALQASDPILREAVKQGRLKVVPARYDLDSGRVEILAAGADKPATVAHAAPASTSAGH